MVVSTPDYSIVCTAVAAVAAVSTVAEPLISTDTVGVADIKAAASVVARGTSKDLLSHSSLGSIDSKSLTSWEAFQICTSAGNSGRGGKDASCADDLTPLPDNYIPGPGDVICGRGDCASDHPGNLRFREIVQSFCCRYEQAEGKLDRSLLVSAIIGTVKLSAAPPSVGRFVKYCSGGRRNASSVRRWYELGDRGAREKCGQCLRDLLPHLFKSSTKAKSFNRKKPHSKSAIHSHRLHGCTRSDDEHKECDGRKSDFLEHDASAFSSGENSESIEAVMASSVEILDDENDHNQIQIRPVITFAPTDSNEIVSASSWEVNPTTFAAITDVDELYNTRDYADVDALNNDYKNELQLIDYKYQLSFPSQTNDHHNRIGYPLAVPATTTTADLYVHNDFGRVVNDGFYVDENVQLVECQPLSLSDSTSYFDHTDYNNVIQVEYADKFLSTSSTEISLPNASVAMSTLERPYSTTAELLHTLKTPESDNRMSDVKFSRNRDQLNPTLNQLLAPQHQQDIEQQHQHDIEQQHHQHQHPHQFTGHNATAFNSTQVNQYTYHSKCKNETSTSISTSNRHEVEDNCWFKFSNTTSSHEARNHDVLIDCDNIAAKCDREDDNFDMKVYFDELEPLPILPLQPNQKLPAFHPIHCNKSSNAVNESVSTTIPLPVGMHLWTPNEQLIPHQQQYQYHRTRSEFLRDDVSRAKKKTLTLMKRHHSDDKNDSKPYTTLDYGKYQPLSCLHHQQSVLSTMDNQTTSNRFGRIPHRKTTSLTESQNDFKRNCSMKFVGIPDRHEYMNRLDTSYDVDRMYESRQPSNIGSDIREFSHEYQDYINDDDLFECLNLLR